MAPELKVRVRAFLENRNAQKHDVVRISKPSFLGASLLVALGYSAAQACDRPGYAHPDHKLPIGSGPFQPDLESLTKYRAPDWFRDEKFGIWLHWGPQAVPRSGDWYARYTYAPGHPQ